MANVTQNNLNKQDSKDSRWKGYILASTAVLLWSLTAVLLGILENKADNVTIVTIMMTVGFFYLGYLSIKRDHLMLMKQSS